MYTCKQQWSHSVGNYAEHDRLFINTVLVPQGFFGSEEKSYLFSRSWGALLIILGELGSKHILLEIKGALPKSKKKIRLPFYPIL